MVAKSYPPIMPRKKTTRSGRPNTLGKSSRTALRLPSHVLKNVKNHADNNGIKASEVVRNALISAGFGKSE